MDSERIQEERLLKRILGVAEVYTTALKTEKVLNVVDEIVDLRQKLARKRKQENADDVDHVKRNRAKYDEGTTTAAPVRIKRPDFKETSRTIVIGKHATRPHRATLSVTKRTVLDQETAVSSSTPDTELDAGDVVRRLDDFLAGDDGIAAADELDISVDVHGEWGSDDL